MYNMGDTTYLGQPKVMAASTIDELIRKLKAYCKENNLAEFDIVLHGGEPLLAGIDYMRTLIEKVNSSLSPAVRVQFSVQTNGVLINDEWSDFFRSYDVTVGVSIDGPEEIHDKYRKYHSGKGSFNDVLKGIKALEKNNDFGILSVIDPRIEPSVLYNMFKSNRFNNINLLFPEANYEKTPLGIDNYFSDRKTIFGDWLIELYSCWRHDKTNRPSIFLFKQIISLLFGKQEFGDEFIGTRENTVLVIETDGSIEVVDTLRVVGNGFNKQGLNITTHKLEDATLNPVTRLYIGSHQKLPERCSRCPVNSVCGGGMLAHRYKRETGFDNPTVYCHDMIKIITHIQNDIFSLLPPDVMDEANVTFLSYDDVLTLINGEAQHLYV